MLWLTGAIAARGQQSIRSRGYQAADAPLVFSLGLGTGISSIAIMVLYRSGSTISDGAMSGISA